MAQATGTHDVIKSLLASRGVSSEEDIAEFLSASPKRTYDPFLMKGMQEAVQTIKAAVEEDQKICIYGDYDCDGVTSVTLLKEVFYSFMKTENISFFIPSRFDDGYGLSSDAIDRIADMDCKLLITVDCGCSQVLEVEHAKDLGMQVIVTDHHLITEDLPDCIVIDPKQEDCAYPFKDLCGCGVAYKLSQALVREFGLPRDVLLNALDIVGIATIGDIVPLVDENRTLAKYGIDRIKRKNREGLNVLCKEIQLQPEKINSQQIAFGIVPNINASGRIGRADVGVSLLSATSTNDALEHARKMTENNAKRKSLQERAFEECLKKAQQEHADDLLPIIHADVHEGVAGIVAGKVKDAIAKPVIIVTGEGEMLKGTGRSVDEIDIHALLEKCVSRFIKFGGHSGACGFTMASDQLNGLRQDVDRAMNGLIASDPNILMPKTHYDIRIVPSDVTLQLASELVAMEPFGKGNEKPLFKIENVKLDGGRMIGNGKHMKFKIKSGDLSIDCVLFGKAEEFSEMIYNEEIADVIGALEINEWNGNRQVQIIVNDIERRDKDEDQ